MPAGSSSLPPDPDDDAALTDDEILLLQELPVETVIGNHLYRLLQLVAAHLSALPPQLDEALLALDAARGIIAGVGERLGEHAELYAAAVHQSALAYERALSSH